ncbi:MAG: beta-lactamase family protein [Thermoanaerobaculia bacterium]|nr:beta-lactamase family protein [Thermoanaerobaculia bacterium]
MSQRLTYVFLTLPVFILGSCSTPGADAPAGADGVWTLPPDAEIRALVEESVEANGVGMVVGVVDANGRRVFMHGRSGAASDRPLDGETVFQLGSVTKPITGLLLSDIVARGEVSLDDPAAEYLPVGVTMPEASQAITLRALATHMSGLPSMPNNFDVAGQPSPYEDYTVAELWDFLSTHELSREVGTEYGYSNLGVSLLGILLGLEKGMSYEALVTERVLQPLAMTSTSITLSEDQMERLAPGHGPYRTPVRTWEMATLQASGSLRSTANDMLNLLEAYLGYRDTPLAEAMALQLTSGAVRGGRQGAV